MPRVSVSAVVLVCRMRPRAIFAIESFPERQFPAAILRKSALPRPALRGHCGIATRLSYTVRSGQGAAHGLPRSPILPRIILADGAYGSGGGFLFLDSVTCVSNSRKAERWAGLGAGRAGLHCAAKPLCAPLRWLSGHAIPCGSLCKCTKQGRWTA